MITQLTERPPTFTRHDDGRVVVDYWPDWTHIELGFLDVVDQRYVQRDHDLITITVDNGKAIYRVESVELGGLLLCRAINRSWRGEPT
jgi:hypothetical protein